MTTAQRVKLGATLVVWVVEVAVTLEVLWYVLHDGEQTLHEAFAEYMKGARERAEHRMAVDEAVDETLDHIRSLPETERDEDATQ